MKHSPEPWAREEGLIFSKPGEVADLRPTYPGNRPLMEINAQRIVACVNYCAGVPSERMKNSRLKNLIEAHLESLVKEAKANEKPANS